MRINVYAEELTERVELITKEAEGREFVGIRFYTELPVTLAGPGATPSFAGKGKLKVEMEGHTNAQVHGPFIHHEGDDDSGAVTFWGKRKMIPLLRRALELLEEFYDGEEDDEDKLPQVHANTEANAEQSEAPAQLIGLEQPFGLNYQQLQLGFVRSRLENPNLELSGIVMEPCESCEQRKVVLAFMDGSKICQHCGRFRLSNGQVGFFNPAYDNFMAGGEPAREQYKSTNTSTNPDVTELLCQRCDSGPWHISRAGSTHCPECSHLIAVRPMRMGKGPVQAFGQLASTPTEPKKKPGAYCPNCGNGPLPVARNMRSTANCDKCGCTFDDAYGKRVKVNELKCLVCSKRIVVQEDRVNPHAINWLCEPCSQITQIIR